MPTNDVDPAVSHRSPERVSHDGVVAAAARIAGVATLTPLLPLPGYPGVWLKAESLQLGGAFKFRGAYNRLVRIAPADRARGVVAFSSGNHAQGVARAAAMLGMPATIVMPADAPPVKRDATIAFGATVVPYDRATESREAIAGALAIAHGAVLVPSFDDPDVVEGQGTAGLEAADQAAAMGLPPFERAVVCCGGGGLSAGIALALPDAAMLVVEPAGWDDMGRSLAAGTILPVAADPPATACDALQTLRVAPLTFDVLLAARATGLSVTEAEIRTAIRHAFRLGLVVEPGGAVALAAILSGRVPADGRPTLVTLSGGNIDPAAFGAVLAGRD